MEIGVFSKCIKDLITDLDRVGVPGLGTFIAEEVPSSFSDKGTTINPPTRTMYFEKGDVSDEDAAPLFDYVCRTMGVDGEQAEVELNWCLGRIHSELGTNLICALPGLGSMKASTSGTYFFVIDENLDISPDTSCLAPVCIKPDGIDEAEKPAEEPAATAAVEPEKPAKKSRKVWKMAIVIVGIIAALVLIILTLNRLFPEQVEDFLYRILYTAEERSLLGR